MRADKKKIEKKQSNPLIPIAITGVTMSLTVAFILNKASERKAAQQTAKAQAPPPAPKAETPSPFSDLSAVPAEKPPPPPKVNIAGDGRTHPMSPLDLLEDATWKKAVGVAKEGEDLASQAQEAKARGDLEHVKLTSRALAKYDEAIGLTADWEEGLLEKHGDVDPRVREVVKARNVWIDRFNALDKGPR